MATTTTLKSVRARIEKLRSNLAAVEKSVPPLADLTEKLRGRLNALVPVDDLVRNASSALLSGNFEMLHPETPAGMTKAAFGLAVAAIGVDKIVEAALAQAADRDDGRLRMSPGDRAEQIQNLRIAIYSEELIEQELIGNEAQRPDVSGAALLGIPLGVVVEHAIWQ